MPPSVPTASLLTLLKRLWNHFSHRRQRQFLLLLGLMLFSAFAEVVSLGAVMPFIGILTVPDMVFGHPLAAALLKFLNITEADQLVMPMTIIFAAAALIAGGIRLLLLWVSTRMAFASGVDLSIEVYRRTLYQPYSIHLARNSSEVISGITYKVNGVVFWVLLPMLILVSSVVLLIAIMLTLIAIDPIVASLAAIGFGASYGVISQLSRRRLERNSVRIAYEQTQVVKALQEGLGGIRDVLLDGAQPVYCDIYRQAEEPLRLAHGNNNFVAGAPRFAMEAIGMVLIAILAYGLSRQVGGLATALPVLGALALGAQRLLPALHQSYSAWAAIVGGYATLADTMELLDQPLPKEANLPVPDPLPFLKTIRFHGVRFRYTEEGPWVLDGCELTIPKGGRIGIVGRTGSGKSTMLDILMGLLVATEGEVLVDNRPISGDCIRAWQRTIAHVPQNIYLADASLAENIAFGIPLGAIDLARVREVACQAQIADFIESRPEGYNALVGERGVRLSGGQCQRIGIARALYKNASVLLFDEATSALDNSTEQAVIDTIQELSSDLTILLIAHRLSTVRRCDIIMELEHGHVVAQGSYEQLLESSPSFRKMAREVV